jgi:DNA-binding MarR family transcriptional regulator
MVMAPISTPPFETTRLVRDTCLCLRVQQAGRAIGRLFDEGFRPLGLTNFQFSLLMMLNRPSPPTIGRLAEDLAMDRTTMTANLKPLQRRRLIAIRRDEADARIKHVALTDAGRALLTEAVKPWQAANDFVRAHVPEAELSALYAGLDAISKVQP